MYTAEYERRAMLEAERLTTLSTGRNHAPGQTRDYGKPPTDDVDRRRGAPNRR